MPAADDDAALIAAAAREAGTMALALAARGVSAWEKSPGNPVTDADIAIDRLLAARLRAARPDYGWVSEESDDGLAPRRRSFLVDPIDGTRDFVRGRDGYAISIAIVERGELVAGVLCAPARRQLFLARRGGGATLNDRPIRVTGTTSLTGARLPVDPSAFSARIWAEPWAGVAVEKPNAIALRIAKVANGEADALFDGRPARALDIAAAVLILTEAGGVVSDHEGALPSFDRRDAGLKSLVAATPAIHAELRARVADGLRRYTAMRQR